MKRVVVPELLDTDSGTPDEVAGSLADLRFFNRWFGGIHTTRSMLESFAQNQHRPSLSLLEVAAGSGDVAGIVQQQFRQRGLELDIVLLDRSRAHLNGSGRAIVGDALSLPFADESFDLVGCGLFVHHLSPDQVVQFASEALRVCRVAVLINDLIRHPVHLGLVYAGMMLYRSRLTRHDAPASVRAAFTPEEMRQLLQRAGASQIQIQRHYLFRMGVIAWKRQPLTKP